MRMGAWSMARVLRQPFEYYYYFTVTHTNSSDVSEIDLYSNIRGCDSTLIETKKEERLTLISSK